MCLFLRRPALASGEQLSASLPPGPGSWALGLSLAGSLTPSSGNIYIFQELSKLGGGCEHPVLSSPSSALCSDL